MYIAASSDRKLHRRLLEKQFYVDPVDSFFSVPAANQRKNEKRKTKLDISFFPPQTETAKRLE